MSLIDLANALHALAPSSIATFQGEAPGGAVAPWLVTNLESPRHIEAEAVTLSTGVYTWRVTITGSTSAQVLGFLGDVIEAWQGARVDVAGLAVGSLRGPDVTGPYLAGLTATDTDLRYQVAQVRFSLTVTTT